MKNLILVLSLLLSSATVFAMSPESMNPSSVAPESLSVTGYGAADVVGVELMARDKATRQALLQAYMQCSQYGLAFQSAGQARVRCSSISRGDESIFHCEAFVTAVCVNTP
jgi:hypothetical protein